MDLLSSLNLLAVWVKGGGGLMEVVDVGEKAREMECTWIVDLARGGRWKNGAGIRH